MSDHVVVHPDGVVIINERSEAVAEFPICDDCRNAYLGPIYYSFDEDDCTEWEDLSGTRIETPHADCTGNLCHNCAGDDTYPDDEEDPRWVRPKHL